MPEVEIPINEVKIENFKSIKSLKLECKRVNVFIGEPNTGKSNIIEAIVGIPSLFYYNPVRFNDNDPNKFIRFKDLSNLFYDNNIEEEIRITFENFTIIIDFKDGSYRCRVEPNLLSSVAFPPSYSYEYEFDRIAKHFKFYRFRPVKLDRRESEFLLPPDGRNLFAVYLTHKSLKSICKDIFAKFGLKIMIEPSSNDLKIVKESEDLLIMYPYETISDTIQRLIFYLSIILTNKNSIIAMEEPEAHTFPYYTKYLAELIALDDSNQYFITTHNPYFLLTLIEKTDKRDLAVYITHYEDYQTKAKKLSEKKLEELLDLGSSAFFNLDILMEE